MNELRPLLVRVVDDLPTFHALAEQWRAIHTASDSPSLFLTWEWLYHWTTQYLGEERLWILLFIDADEQLRGIAPFYVRRTHRRLWGCYREVAFLGSRGVGSTYLDVIAARADKRAVLACLCEYLFQASQQWDIVTLAHLPAESITVDLLQEQFDRRGKVAAIMDHTGCPIVDLATCVAAHREALRPSLRRTLQRKRRYLEQQGTVTYSRGDDIGAALDLFRELHQKRWAARSPQGGAFRDSRFRAFHTEITRAFHAQGRLDFSFLCLDGTPLAGIYGYRHEHTYYYYLPGFDPEQAAKGSPGMLLLAHCMEQAIEEGCRRFDFLQGPAGYKMTWADRSTRCLSLRLYNRTPSALALHLVESIKRGAKILLR
ncbi:MAG: GNAT family N-acetyltransferase [Nitrospira sp.]|nr:GNAT family N-acetyltransferase [Nitrospira sp.]